MKQVFVINGKPIVEDIPIPMCTDEQVLVKNRCSLISAGTELASMGKKQNILNKAMKNPQLVKKAINKIKNEGIFKGGKQISARVSMGLAPGYSSAGEVVSIGNKVQSFKEKDRVACAGGGYATHSEYVAVPKNLIVRIPEGVSYEEAAFTTVGTVALQGVRITDPKLGEEIAVLGLGIIGLLTCKILDANGVKVTGIDINPGRVERAKKMGFNASKSIIREGDKINGFDAVIVTADTRSSEPINQAMDASRKKGRVIVVGNVGLEIERAKMYKKELELKISTSYGPGRYDPEYEEQGKDYPIAYVRWTENRNMQAFLELLKAKKISVKDLIDREYSIDESVKAYEALKARSIVGGILKYQEEAEASDVLELETSHKKKGQINVGLIGAGGFAQSAHLPNMAKNCRYNIYGICDTDGKKAKVIAQQYKASIATTNPEKLMTEKRIDAIFICTRHDSHAELTIKSLKEGKHVLVEKPMVLKEEQLEEVVEQAKKSKKVLMTGHNRKYSKHARRLREMLDEQPMIITCRVDAGYVPEDKWVQNPEIGGGRIIGEGVHFIDLIYYLTGSNPKSIKASRIKPTKKYFPTDNIMITIEHENGSLSTLIYTAMGSKSMGKERVELFQGGNSYLIDSFETLSKNCDVIEKGLDKGSERELEEFADAVQGKKDISRNLERDILTTKTAFQILKGL